MIPTRGFGSVAVPILGQGTWNLEADDRAQAVRALRRGLDLGLTHVDTAEMYGDGRVEEMVGEAIAGRREKVFLVSKVLPTNASAKGTVRACENSLARLKTDHLDCYLLHWPGDHPLEETFGAFEKLRAAGKIRAWGVSNFDVGELEDALQIATPACNQVLHHLEARYVEGKLADLCRKNHIALVGYSPFGSGHFPARNQVLVEIARAHSATTHQIALAFLCRRAFAIPKAADARHVEANAAAAEIALSSDEEKAIDAAFPIRGTSLPYL